MIDGHRIRSTIDQRLNRRRTAVTNDQRRQLPAEQGVARLIDHAVRLGTAISSSPATSSP